PILTSRKISNGCTIVVAEEVGVEAGFDPLTADYESTNCTAADADDGTIVLIVEGGSGNYSYLWNDAVETKNRSDLAPGIYSVVITDLETGEEVELTDIEITEPQPLPPPQGKLFEFPMLNDLQWVVNPVDPEEEPDQVTLDNVLFN